MLGRLVRVADRFRFTGRREQVPAAAVFVLIGAEPHTEWLRDVLRLGERGYILTGRDLPVEAWPLARTPLPFETSLPGVFAAGDVRYSSVKRVATSGAKRSSPVSSATCSSFNMPPDALSSESEGFCRNA